MLCKSDLMHHFVLLIHFSEEYYCFENEASDWKKFILLFYKDEL